MRLNPFVIVVVSVACARAPVQQVSTQQAPAPSSGDVVLAAAEASIRPADFYARIAFLASDALGGRDTPSPGLEAAAAYIASELHRFGARPAGDDGTFIQRWPYTTRGVDLAGMRFDVVNRGTTRSLEFRSEFAAQAALRGSFAGRLAYVGTAIPPADVRGTTLRGRAVLISPPAGAPAQDLFRARAAADSAGAGALIVILPDNAGAEQVAALASAPARGVPAIPLIYLRRDRARQLFLDAGLDFASLMLATSAIRPVQFNGPTVTLNAALTETVHRVPNVAGIIEGSDPQLKNTYVVFSAHMDHVGSNCRGTTPQDNICNGADDDASGTAAIIEIAEAVSMLPVKPKRSLLFLAVSGEEKGLLGSAHYADNPTVPIESIVANVNIDMIGRNNPDSVVVIGQTYSSLGPLLHSVNERLPGLRMTISEDLWPEQRFFFRSDHFNFARRDVPAIFFFTGTHEDYHAATDHVDKIDLDKITRITRLIFHYGLAIANETDAPRWDPAGLEEVRALVRSRGR